MPYEAVCILMKEKVAAEILTNVLTVSLKGTPICKHERQTHFTFRNRVRPSLLKTNVHDLLTLYSFHAQRGFN